MTVLGNNNCIAWIFYDNDYNNKNAYRRKNLSRKHMDFWEILCKIISAFKKYLIKKSEKNKYKLEMRKSVFQFFRSTVLDTLKVERDTSY